ncbi:MAG: pyridoxamine 5'-phosphate oxidase family protein [Proteobacteria bacterium]|nr:pyridoxamine 5'-phosphate oxidase family protein [Pseudomonadota bacterium]
MSYSTRTSESTRTPDPHRIETEAQLREVLSDPSPLVQEKIFDFVDDYARAFIERAPLLLMATTDREGRLDVSPKGDAPGFAVVEDERTLLVPDRPGNKLAYGFRNMLEQPRVGLIFVVPGVKETLRVNGSAELTRDPELLERLSARNKPALLVTRVTVEECFFHCGKAFVRSALWKPESWPTGFRANIGKQLARKSNADDAAAEAVEASLERSYRDHLY